MKESTLVSLAVLCILGIVLTVLYETRKTGDVATIVMGAFGLIFLICLWILRDLLIEEER